MKRNVQEKVVTFETRYRSSFKALNLAWIEQYFRVESKDIAQTDNPEECLASGGEIFFVVVDDQAIGTCAMYRTGPKQFELAKMAVHPDYRGLGFGDRLMEAAEAWARTQSAKEILILSNTILEPAISLYKKHGYEATHLGPHPDYERCNIEMRKML